MRAYKYILLSNNTGERLELQNAPIGWDKNKVNIIKSLIYFGVLKSLSVEFAFVGDGYTFLEDQYLKFGADANVICRLYKGNKWLFDGKVNFPVGKFQRKNKSYKVDLVQSSFIQKWQTREDVKINVRNNISMDRNAIAPAEYRQATIRGKTILFYSEFEDSLILDGMEESELFNRTLPFLLNVNNSTSSPYVQQADAADISGDPTVLYLAQNAFFHNTSSVTQTPRIKFDLDWTYTYEGADSLSSIVRIKVRMMRMNADNTLDAVLFERTTTGFYGHQAPASFDDDVEVGSGQYLIFTLERYSFADVPLSTSEMSDGLATYVTFNSMFMSISIGSVEANTTHPVILPHELFTNIVAQLTGQDNAFYSEIFGREDLGYDEDGTEAYLSITKGEILRGKDIDDIQIATSFRDAFTSYNAVLNLGVLITEMEIGGKRKTVIRIDPKNDLFNGNIAADIGEVSDLEIDPAQEFLFNSVKAGYPKMEYEQENGLDEFNTEAQYTNSIESVKKELSIVSVYNGDGYGIEFARRLGLSIIGTTDTKYDDKIFFLDLVKQEDGTLISRRLEGIEDLTGVFSPETVINARISPGQNLLRWAKYLSIPLHRKNNNVYFFQSKEKNSGLRVVTYLGESSGREDLQIPTPRYFIPEFREFKCPLSLENLLGIMANPLGIVKYTYEGEKFHDYLFEINAETEGANADWKMLGTRPTPVQRSSNAQASDSILKFGDGIRDFVKYGNGPNDLLLYE